MAFTIGIDLVANDYASSTIETAESNLMELDNLQSQSTDSLDANTRAAKENKGAMSELGGAIQGALVAYGGMKGVQLVGQLIDEGNAANVAQATFRELTGGVNEASAALQTMRTATGGVVDDVTLMNGANRLLLMGLVQNGDEAAKMTQIAVTLGRAMGQDASESIEGFASLLANQSIPRLDNFGISSDRVRAKVEALKDAGMEATEAFSMAVMEEGARSLDKLGSAASAAITPLDAVSTKIDNIKTAFEQRVATGANSLIGILMYGLGQLPEQQAMMQEQVQKAQDFINQNYDYMAELMTNASYVYGNAPTDWHALSETARQGFAKAIGDAYTALQSDPAISDANLYKLIAQIPEDQQYAFIQSIRSTVQLAASEAQAVVENQTRADGQSTFRMLMGLDDRGIEQTANIAATRAVTSYWLAYNAAWQTQASGKSMTEKLFGMSEDEMAEAGQRASDIISQSMRAQNDYSYFMGNEQDLPDINEYMSADAASAVREQYEQIADQFEHIKELHDQGFITDEDYDKAANLKDQFSELADEADRAADALKNMKLPDLFGQTDGGVQGQMTDAIIEQMRKNGRSDAEIEAAQKALDLQSGRETTASVAFNEQIVPMLADMPVEDMQKAVANMKVFMELAAQNNVTPEQMAAMMPGATGFMPGAGAGASFTVKPGDTLSAISALYKVPIEDLMAATGGTSNPNLIYPGTYQMKGGPGGMMMQGFDPNAYFAQQMGLGTGHSSDIGEGMEDMKNSIDTMTEPVSVLTQSFDTLEGSAGRLASNAGELSDNIKGAKDQAEGLQDTLTTIGNKRWVATLDVKINAPGLDAIMAVIGMGGSLAGSGNSVPGDTRVGGKPGGARVSVP